MSMKFVSIQRINRFISKMNSKIFLFHLVIGCHCKAKPVVVKRKLGESLWYDALVNVKLTKIDVEIASKYYFPKNVLIHLSNDLH